MSFTDRTRRGETAGTFPAYPMMLRSAASPGSVGSVGRRWHIVASSYRCQTSADPLFAAISDRQYAGGNASRRRKQKRRPKAAFLFSEITRLLDLGFLELDMLLGDRIVFAEGQLFRLGAAVLAGHVEEAGVGGRQKLDLDVCGFGHDVRPSVVVRFAPLEHGKTPGRGKLGATHKGHARKVKPAP